MEYLSERIKSNIVSITTKIHPTAIVDPNAKLGDNVSIGPYAIIGPNVVIGEHNRIAPHTVIEGWTDIGDNNEIGVGTIIGNKPQDLKYNGEDSLVKIGNNNIIKEYVTINRGTRAGGMVTSIGNNNLLMTNSHIAHDATITQHCIIAHGSLVGGHVVVEKGATVAAQSGIHQFSRVGQFSMIGLGSNITKDVAPFTMVKGNPPKLSGLNYERLRRIEMKEEDIAILKDAYRRLFRSGELINKAINQIDSLYPQNPYVKILLGFFGTSSRGTYR